MALLNRLTFWLVDFYIVQKTNIEINHVSSMFFFVAHMCRIFLVILKHKNTFSKDDQSKWLQCWQMDVTLYVYGVCM